LTLAAISASASEAGIVYSDIGTDADRSNQRCTDSGRSIYISTRTARAARTSASARSGATLAYAAYGSISTHIGVSQDKRPGIVDAAAICRAAPAGSSDSVAG
jgi:hypothetical protein